MKYPEYELKTAVYNRLTTGANKINWVVVESATPKQKMPFIEIGECLTPSDHTKSGPGTTPTISFHCWSRINSSEQVSDMTNDILGSITVTADTSPSFLTLTNHNVNRQDQDGPIASLKGRDEISELRHGVLDIKFTLQEK